MTALISIVVPAYNEASVIGRCLDALLQGHRPGESEIIVACNGCSDDTAAIARRYGDPVKVIETDVPSKTNALNLGDAAATGFPRIYLDADVAVSHEAIKQIAAALASGPALAAAPRPVYAFLPSTSWGVRAYYRFWTSLPYVQEGMIAAGVYALSEDGRARFEKFPELIADDGYVRMLFEPRERMQVTTAVSQVWAPVTLRDLLKIKTRSRLGVLQLAKSYPELASREAKTKHYHHALLQIAGRPSLYLSALPYTYVAVASWLRAQRQMNRSGRYVWERDDSSRLAESSKG
jgi:glycosyltransferase involved in cell wall biosynthesis